MNPLGWLVAALMVALMLTGGVGLLAAAVGRVLDAWDVGFLVTTGLGFGLFLHWLIETRVWLREKGTANAKEQTAIRLDQAKAYHNELENDRTYAALEALLAGTVEPAKSPLIGGGLLDAWEQHHLQGLLETLRHGEAAGGLTTGLLVHKAFVDHEHWSYWLGILAESGIVDKANGMPTALKAGRTWTWAKRQLLNGLFECPAQYKDAPLPRLPLEFNRNLYGKVEPQKAGKAGEKGE